MITGNEPAMPNVAFDQQGNFTHVHDEGHFGLTIRQHFAAMAMQGLIASTDWNESVATDGHIKYSAELSMRYADALISELNKPA